MAKEKGKKLLMEVECEVQPDPLTVASKGSLKVDVNSQRTAPYKVLVSCCAKQGFLKLSGKRSYCSKPLVVFPNTREEAKWDVGVPQNCPRQEHQLDIVAEASRLVSLPPNYPRGGIRAILSQAEFAATPDRIPIAMAVKVK